jgi:ketosteroid isomerase-like protein
MIRSTVTLILLIVISSCSAPSVDQKAEAEKIMELSREWAKTAQTTDLEKTLSYWAKDAIVMSPGQPATKGQDELRKMLESSAEIPGFEINWEPKEAYVSKSGDLGYSIGVNYINMQDSLGNKITMFNKGVEIWKKQEDGSWKCVVDIFNSDPSVTSLK